MNKRRTDETTHGPKPNTTEHKSGKKKTSRFICKALSTKCPVNKLEGLITIDNKVS